MKVTFISDTHTRHKRIELPGGDMLIFSGDAMSSGYYNGELNDFVDWIKDQPYKYKICIAGNHDRYCESFPKDFIKDVFEKYYDNGVRYICDEEIEIEGIRIYGTPYQPYFCGWAFNVMDEEILTNIYKQIPEGIDILVTHCPPFGVLDKSHMPRPYKGTTGEEPLGSKELLNILDYMENPPKYHCFGHIHGDGGKVIKEGGITFINASVCNESYEPKNEIVTLDI